MELAHDDHGPYNKSGPRRVQEVVEVADHDLDVLPEEAAGDSPSWNSSLQWGWGSCSPQEYVAS